MSTNKKFRIQNGADIVGELSINDVTVIGADGKVVEGAVADAVASLTAADIADLQSQVSAIIGTSPEHLDTLQELVAAFEGADTNLVTSVATNTSDIATINTTLTNGVATPTDVADLQSDIAANAAAIAAANSRTSGISTSSGSSNIQMGAEVDMDSNDIKNAGDVYAARGFIDTIEAESLTVQTGTVSFEGSTVNFGSSTITGGGFSSATNAQIDQHLNKSTANPGEFVKWNGTDYEWTDYIQGRVASTMIEVEGTLKTEQPGSTLDWQNGLVHFGGSQVIVDTPTSANLAANKSYVDGVVAATVDAAPAALDTLNELAAALGDDANFASTVTASISTKADEGATNAALATKADDAATTAALATKATVTDVDVIDTFVKGPSSYSLSNGVSTNIEFWGLGNGASKIGYSNGALSWSMDNTSATGGFNYQQNSLTYYNMSNLVVGTDYVLTIASPSRAGNLTVVVGDSSNTVDAQVVMPAGSTTVTSKIEFTAVATSRLIALDAASTGVYSISSVQVTDAESLQTTATQVVPAINELHTELNALSSTQSGDQSNLQSQITAEVARASSAEAVNAANIVSETSARSSADAALQSDIVGLQNQVGTIISGSPASLDTLVEIVSAFETADASLSGVITANGGRLTTAENNITALGADITAEESARGSADATLQAAIDAEALTRSNLGSELLGYINANSAAITAGDNANSAEVATEKSRAEGAEATLQSNIDALTSSTGGDVSGLQSSIDAEEAARIAADSALQSSIDAEESRATSAEAGLQSQISNVLSNTDATALNSLAEIVAEFQSADSTLTGAVAGHGTRLTSLESSTSAILAWDTDNLSEGTTNKFWTPERSKSALTGGLCITYNSSTGEIKIDEAETASSLHVASSSDANELGGQAPSHYRINVYDVNGTIVN